MTDLMFLKPLVARVLQDNRHQWTVQGFGFLRTYFGPADNPKRFRLNLWDHRFSVKNVSTIHDHPWDLTSLIIAGHMQNQRYVLADYGATPSHSYTTIRTGEGGGLIKDPTRLAYLEPKLREIYDPGESYSQKADEIHETIFDDGTVTLNERIGDTEHARVFWPYGTEWVDAIPREASRDEVSDAVLGSLRRFF